MEIAFRCAYRVETECHLRSVLRPETEQAKCQRINSVRDQVIEHGEPARALADLCPFHPGQERVVYEVTHERLARRALRLRNLILMMDRDMVEAARMNIERLAEVLHRHRRALDMPSRVPASPRTVPLHQMVRLVEYPQRKVVRAFLVRRMFKPLTRMLLVETLTRESSDPAPPAPLLDVEVDARRRHVRVAVLDDAPDERDHLADMVSRARQPRRLWQLNIEPRAVAFELRDIEFRDFLRRLALGPRGFLDLVLARILIRSHMADVSDIHHVTDVVAVEFERASQRIDEKIGAHVTQMLRQVNRRPARIVGDFGNAVGGRPGRVKLLDTAAQAIEDIKRLHGRDTFNPIAPLHPLTRRLALCPTLKSEGSLSVERATDQFSEAVVGFLARVCTSSP